MSVAQHAQAVVPTSACVGAVLAAALEARAQAALGRAEQTRDALRRAETLLSRLDMETAAASAFVYNEAQRDSVNEFTRATMTDIDLS
jgi:hypothetical protein